MTSTPSAVGPDLVICGAARAGTSFLASLLESHQQVDAGAVKEPNFFSREWHRGLEWYDSLYQPRHPGLLRLDASTSYTFAHFPDALANLAKHAPGAVVIYSVRDPIQRLLSHSQLHRDYFRNDSARTLGEALTGTDVYTGASDYERWLATLYRLFPEERVIVVPFGILTSRAQEVLDLACRAAGIDPQLRDAGAARAMLQRNEVVEFRYTVVRHAWRLMHVSGAYPRLRRLVGSHRMRSLRSLVTRASHHEHLTEALVSCSREQLLALDRLYTSAQRAATQALQRQDARTGFGWTEAWLASCPVSGSDDVQFELAARR